MVEFRGLMQNRIVRLQQDGTPTSTDRLLATKLVVACALYIDQQKFGVMVANSGEDIEAVPIENVAGKGKYVPLDHPWMKSARMLGTCLGDYFDYLL